MASKSRLLEQEKARIFKRKVKGRPRLTSCVAKRPYLPFNEKAWGKEKMSSRGDIGKKTTKKQNELDYIQTSSVHRKKYGD